MAHFINITCFIFRNSKISPKLEFGDVFQTYKCIGLATNVYNSCFKEMYVAEFCGLATCQIVAVFVCVSSVISEGTGVKMISPAVILLYIAMALECFTLLIVVYGHASEIHRMSKSILETLPGRLILKFERNLFWRRKYARKAIQALPTIKIYFGSNNHIEKTTPLVLQQFCLFRIVELLVLLKINR